MSGRRLTILLLLVACSSSTEPNGPEIPPSVGAYCTSTTPSVVHATDGSVTVGLNLNTTTYQDVRRSDGVVISQEVKGCHHYSCVFNSTGGASDQELITSCQQLVA